MGAPDYMVELEEELVEMLRSFRALNRFKKATLMLMVSMLSEDQTKKCRQAFVWLDEDADGMLSHADLQFRLGDEAEDCEDVFSEGDMYYTEFLAATFDRSHIDSKICKAAFAVFDQDGNAQITAEELSRPESMLGYL